MASELTDGKDLGVELGHVLDMAEDQGWDPERLAGLRMLARWLRVMAPRVAVGVMEAEIRDREFYQSERLCRPGDAAIRFVTDAERHRRVVEEERHLCIRCGVIRCRPGEALCDGCLWQ